MLNSLTSLLTASTLTGCCLCTLQTSHAQESGEFLESEETPDLNVSQDAEADTAQEKPRGRPGQDEDKVFTWGISGGDLYQFDSSIDGGGSFSVNRTFIAGGIEYVFSPSLTLDFDIGFEADSYVFDGNGSFKDAAGGVPWTTTLDVTLSASARWKIDDEWRIFLRGFLGWAGERDASFGESFTGGGTFGAAYTFSDDLTLGAGALLSAQLEDSILFIPSIIVDWRISERLFVSNVRGPVNYPTSAGVEFLYYLSYELNLALGARYEIRRFRLDDQGAPLTRNGVGQERSIPVWFRVEWRPMDKLRLHLVAGCSFGEQLQLADSSGWRFAKEDADPAPFLGFFVGFEF